MKKLGLIIAGIWVLLVTISILYPNIFDSLKSKRLFGSTGYPTAVDTSSTLPNPNPTDSVATVSHSALHTNENDSIKAIETKLGIGASTASNGTMLTGNGAGSSIWSASPTLTGLTLANLLVTGSSTLQNFTFSNATGTQATTTNFFSTNGTVTNLNSTTANLASLTVGSCSGCSSAGGLLTYSSTSVQLLATTTIVMGSMQGKDNIEIKFYTPTLIGTASTSAVVYVSFNSDNAQHYAQGGVIATNPNISNNNTIGAWLLPVDSTQANRYVDIHLFNGTSTAKMGVFQGSVYSTTTPTVQQFSQGTFVWNNITSRVTSIDFWTDKNQTVSFATGTELRVLAQ